MSSRTISGGYRDFEHPGDMEQTDSTKEAIAVYNEWSENRILFYWKYRKKEIIIGIVAVLAVLTAVIAVVIH